MGDRIAGGARARHAGALVRLCRQRRGRGAPAPLHAQDLDAFVRVLHVNLVGAFLCLKHVVPHLVTGDGGSFVAISSFTSQVTHPYFGAYPAAKAGVDHLMRNAA